MCRCQCDMCVRVWPAMTITMNMVSLLLWLMPPEWIWPFGQHHLSHTHINYFELSKFTIFRSLSPGVRSFFRNHLNVYRNVYFLSLLSPAHSPASRRSKWICHLLFGCRIKDNKPGCRWAFNWFIIYGCLALFSTFGHLFLETTAPCTYQTMGYFYLKFIHLEWVKEIQSNVYPFI